ncbi:MAG: LacI family DNA-binding transcriptional regulator [Planctomycetota bacterium]
MATLRQIADNAGVSVATVSRALNHASAVSSELRERVLREADRLGYSLPTTDRGVTRIALAYPGAPVHLEYGSFDASIVSGVVSAATADRFEVSILDIARLRDEDESYTQMFRRIGVAGVVLRTYSDQREVCERIAAEGFPSVVVADRFDDPNVNYVAYDSTADTELAVQHLTHLGHTRIALVVHAVRDSDHVDRRTAYERVMHAAGIELANELIVEVVADVDGGASAIGRLMSLPRPPTAVVFTDPLSTIGGLRRALELGLNVPEDLSIIGFDDANMRKLTHPTYTAVCQDSEQLAATATRWLTSELKRRDGRPFRELQRTYFEVNGTTCAPPARAVRVSPHGRRMEVPK